MRERERDAWCSPRWLAELIGRVSLDPCSNPRSHINADRRLSLENGEDGLDKKHSPGVSVFVNPPYSDVMPWVKRWAYSPSIWLVRADFSTQWARLLLGSACWLWHPNERIAFEAPDGIKASTNPFPHVIVGCAGIKVPHAIAMSPRGYLWTQA